MKIINSSAPLVKSFLQEFFLHLSMWQTDIYRLVDTPLSYCHNGEYIMARTGRPGLNLTPQRIRWAIKSTQSMGQAAQYLNTSFKTFKK